MLQTVVSLLRGQHWLVTFDNIKHCQLLQDVPPPSHLSCSFNSMHSHLSYTSAILKPVTQSKHTEPIVPSYHQLVIVVTLTVGCLTLVSSGSHWWCEWKHFFFYYDSYCWFCPSLYIVTMACCLFLQSDTAQRHAGSSLPSIPKCREVSYVGLSDQKKTSKPCPAQPTACKRLPSATAAPSISLSVSFGTHDRCGPEREPAQALQREIQLDHIRHQEPTEQQMWEEFLFCNT